MKAEANPGHSGLPKPLAEAPAKFYQFRPTSPSKRPSSPSKPYAAVAAPNLTSAGSLR
jgi:hypothetical protein